MRPAGSPRPAPPRTSFADWSRSKQQQQQQQQQQQEGPQQGQEHNRETAEAGRKLLQHAVGYKDKSGGSAGATAGGATAERRSSQDETKAAAAAAAGGDDEWAASYDGKWSRVYYFNRATGKSQWEAPPDFTRHVADLPSEADML